MLDQLGVSFDAVNYRPNEYEEEVFMTTLQTVSLRGRAYQSYLVRFWQSAEQGAWHASAQCVQTGSTQLFGDIEQLLAFLQTEVKHKAGINMDENHPIHGK